MTWQGDASSSGSAKSRCSHESKSFGQKDLQQVQSDSPQGRGEGVVREHQAQATARLIQWFKRSKVQRFKRTRKGNFRFETSNGVSLWHVSRVWICRGAKEWKLRSRIFMVLGVVLRAVFYSKPAFRWILRATT